MKGRVYTHEIKMSPFYYTTFFYTTTYLQTSNYTRVPYAVPGDEGGGGVFFVSFSFWV